MDVREKLLGLIAEAKYICANDYSDHTEDEYIADTLLDNGVTVQEWIPVKDELRKEQGYYRVYHKNSKSISDRFYYKDCPDLFVNVMDDPITYWKPIEQPPKGE